MIGDRRDERWCKGRVQSERVLSEWFVSCADKGSALFFGSKAKQATLASSQLQLRQSLWNLALSLARSATLSRRYL